MITSKSLYHTNIAILFDESKFKAPDNSQFASVFSGIEATGIRFIDNPVMKSKVLVVPYFESRIILEGHRVRIEDESKRELQASMLPYQLHKTKEAIFNDIPIVAYGFNFDIYYRFNTFVPIKEIYASMFKMEKSETRDVLDVGIQFTLDNQKEHYKEVWFTKVVSPLELGVHINRHFDSNKFPNVDELKDQLVKTYEEADSIIKSFKFNI